jgi:hypothetical protein
MRYNLLSVPALLFIYALVSSIGLYFFNLIIKGLERLLGARKLVVLLLFVLIVTLVYLLLISDSPTGPRFIIL